MPRRCSLCIFPRGGCGPNNYRARTVLIPNRALPASALRDKKRILLGGWSLGQEGRFCQEPKVSKAAKALCKAFSHPSLKHLTIPPLANRFDLQWTYENRSMSSKSGSRSPARHPYSGSMSCARSLSLSLSLSLSRSVRGTGIAKHCPKLGSSKPGRAERLVLYIFPHLFTVTV